MTELGIGDEVETIEEYSNYRDMKYRRGIIEGKYTDGMVASINLGCSTIYIETKYLRKVERKIEMGRIKIEYAITYTISDLDGNDLYILQTALRGYRIPTHLELRRSEIENVISKVIEIERNCSGV